MKTNQETHRKLAGLVFALIALLLVHESPTVAQTQTTTTQKSEVEQLKDRLQQLEQTVLELKGQINAAEESRKNPTPVVMDATYTPATTSTAAAAKPAQDSDKKGESTFEVYGFAMLDAGYQFKQNDPDWFDVIRPVKLPAFAMSLRQTGMSILVCAKAGLVLSPRRRRNMAS